MPNLVTLEFEGQAVRAIDVDGRPHFVAKDIADRLGYANAADAIAKHCKGVAKRYPLQTAGGMQSVRVLAEPDVYRLIASSHLPAAERFEAWLFEEVLPSIREDGGYMIDPPDETPEQLAARALRVLMATVERQKSKIAELQPAAEALNRLSGASGSLSLTDAAKGLGAQPKAFIAWLAARGWIYKRTGGASWVPYQSHLDNGDLTIHTREIPQPGGRRVIAEQVRVTPKGMARLAKILPSDLRAPTQQAAE